MYDVATKMRHPPWATTSNLLVKTQEKSRFFDLRFPKTGKWMDGYGCVCIMCISFACVSLN